MRAVELFAGAGGMSLGLKRAGIEVVQAYDTWRPAVEVYRRNVGSHVWQADLKDIFRIGPMIAALAPDIIVGGPPCQDFSPAGERIEGERAALTRAFAMYICIARPHWFVMENVPQVATSMAWRDARAMLVTAGYGLTESKLNASLYGVPQARKRLFVIGRIGEADGFLTSALAAAASASPTTVRDMLGDVPDDADANLIAAGAYYTRPFYEGRGVRTLDEPAPSVIRTTRERPRPHYLANPHPQDPIPAEAAAVLTQEQVSRIQGFPPSWDWSPVSDKRGIDQMIANAVPAALAEAIGHVILAREAGETIPAIEGRFGQWLLRWRGFSKPAVRNAKSRLNRARRILGGRTFADAAMEMAALESADGFVSLPTATRSDLRKAVRLYRDWQREVEARRARRVRSTSPVQVEAVAA